MYVTSELACTVEVERLMAKIGGGNETSPISLRVTTLFRREDRAWKIVHRHADPITTAQPAESVIQSQAPCPPRIVHSSALATLTHTPGSGGGSDRRDESFDKSLDEALARLW
jgi:hypothetical protein